MEHRGSGFTELHDGNRIGNGDLASGNGFTEASGNLREHIGKQSHTETDTGGDRNV